MQDGDRRPGHRFWDEVFNAGSSDPGRVLDEILGPEFVLHDLAQQKNWHQQDVKRVVGQIRQGLPSARAVIEEDIPALENWEVTRLTLHANSTRPGPAHQQVILNATTMSRIEDGRLAETWLLWDEPRATAELPKPEGSPRGWTWHWPPWW